MLLNQFKVVRSIPLAAFSANPLSMCDMTSLSAALNQALHSPQPADLVALQEALLLQETTASADQATVERGLEVAGEFYAYLSQVQSALTARQFSELASWLDIGAVGAVAFEHIVTTHGGSLAELATAALSETLMVLASRQYVKAWDVESRVVHDHAAWYLRQALWRLSQERQAQLSPEARLAALRQILAPVADPAVPAAGKLLLLGRLFQVLLLVIVGPLAAAEA